MPTSIEQLQIEKLQKRTDQISADLEALKLLADANEKEQKQKKLADDLEKLKADAQKEAETLTDLAKKERLEAIQNTLNSYSDILSQLETEVVDTQRVADIQEQVPQSHQEVSNTSSPEGVDEENENTEDLALEETEEQGFGAKVKGAWNKATEFTKEQWSNVWDKEKWDAEPGKNALRVAGFVATGVGALALAYKGIKSLFGWGKKKSEKAESPENVSSKKKKPWWKKALLWAGGVAGAGAVGLWGYKNWEGIKGWFGDILGKHLDMKESIAKVEAEVRNGIAKNEEAGVFSAHFDGITYDEKTGIMESYGESIEIDESSRKIKGLDVQFEKREELIHAANMVNFMKRNLKGKGMNDQPFGKTDWGGDISFNMSESGKREVLSASDSNEWTWILGTAGAVGGGFLGYYCGGVKGTLGGVLAGGAGGVAIGNAIDNNSDVGRAATIISKGVNFDKFINFLNAQKDKNGESRWTGKAEQYESVDTTPLHFYLNEIKKEIDDTYGQEDSARRSLELEVDSHNPNLYYLKSYSQKVPIHVEGQLVLKDNALDFSKISKFSLGKYSENDRGDGLDVDFPSTEEGLKELIRVANFTNKLREDYKDTGKVKMPFSYGKYGLTLEMNTTRDSWYKTSLKLIERGTLSKKFPTLFQDIRKQKRFFGQKYLWDQAKQDSEYGSQYIKYLHQMQKSGEKTYWEKVT